MKKVLFLLLAFMATVAVTAQQVSRQQALQKAQQFMPGKQFGQAKSFARGDSPTDMEPFYIFNAKGQKGFVIVSGDDRTEPILGYSDKGEVTEKNMPENLKYWLECYEIQMKSLDQTKAAGSRGVTRSASKAAVDPLIQAHWDQGVPYNTKCPSVVTQEVEGESVDTYVDIDQPGYNPNNRCVTGCVATAMAQVMYYWFWPESCEAMDKYDIGYWVNQGTNENPNWQFVVDHSFNGLPATTFNWQSMTTTYSADATGPGADEVAKLMRYCGQAVKMNYGLGAYGGSSANVTASDMVNYFGYGKTAKTVYRMLYTVADWEDLIYNELFYGRPVLYGGSSASGGHQFICDGYDGNGLFHFNWGWSGSSDGYFVLSLANPQDLGSGGGTNTDGFSYFQDAIIGLQRPGRPGIDDTETPDIYGLINDSEEWVTEYTRSSAAEDFTGVSLPRKIFMQYSFVEEGMPRPDYSLDYAWGLYQDGELLDVYGTDNTTLTDAVNWRQNTPAVDFGSGLADGTYMFRQVYRPQGTDKWITCQMLWSDEYLDSYLDMSNQMLNDYLAMSYIKATISGNTLTLEKANEDEYFSTDIQIKSVTYSPSTLEYGKAVEVTVNLTNNGDAFQELICFRYGQDAYDMTLVCGSVEPGQTGTVKLHFVPPYYGEVPVQIAVDDYEDIVVWKETLNIDYPKPQSLTATETISGLNTNNRVLTGTTFDLTASITNAGENTYDNYIELRMFEKIPGASSSPLFKKISKLATIAPGETKDVEFTLDGLNLDRQYGYDLYYKSSGYYVNFNLPTSTYFFSLTAANPGDANGSGGVDANDVKIVVDYIMGKNPPGFVFGNADMNNDGKVDAVDLVKLINALPK